MFFPSFMSVSLELKVKYYFEIKKVFKKEEKHR